MTIRRALDWSETAAVRTSDGRLLHIRLMVGWQSPTASWLDGTATSGGGSVLEFASIAAALLRDGARALHYRLQHRRDWWLVKQVDDDEPLATLHPDRARAIEWAERELQAAVAAGGRYLPYGR